MALRKPSDTATVAATVTDLPAFEDELNPFAAETVAETPAEVLDSRSATVAAQVISEAAASADLVVAEVKALEAPAPRGVTTPVALPVQSAIQAALKTGTSLDGSKDVIPVDELVVMPLGTFDRIVVDTGGFNNKTSNTFLGSEIKLELVSWSWITIVTTGAQNDKEADKLVRGSYDGRTINGSSTTVEQYLAELKARGYTRADTKRYIEMYAFLDGAEKLAEIPEDDRRLVQVSLSPQSTGAWTSFLLQQRIVAARKGAPSTKLRVTSLRKTLGSNTFGVMQFHAG